MCEARIIVIRADGGEQTVMEDCATVHRDGDRFVARNVMGERVEFEGTIEKVDLMSSVIMVRS